MPAEANRRTAVDNARQHQVLVRLRVYWCQKTSRKHTFRIRIRTIEFIGFSLPWTGSLNQCMKSRSNLGSLLPPHFIFAPPRFNVCHCTFNRLHQEIHHRHTTVRRGCIHAFHRLFSKIQSITHFRHLASRSKAERPFPENTDMIPHPADGFKPVEMLPMWKCCQYQCCQLSIRWRCRAGTPYLSLCRAMTSTTDSPVPPVVQNTLPKITSPRKHWAKSHFAFKKWVNSSLVAKNKYDIFLASVTFM